MKKKKILTDIMKDETRETVDSVSCISLLTNSHQIIQRIRYANIGQRCKTEKFSI
jgi:hypothetical protein